MPALLAIAGLALGACGTEPAVVTVELIGYEGRGGACPTPPGAPRTCPMAVLAEATFREHAGTPAQIHDVSLTVCHGERCDEYPPDQRQADAFGIAANGAQAVTFNRTYFGNELATRVTVGASVTTEGDTYTIEAALQPPAP